MKTPSPITRRQFLKNAGAASASTGALTLFSNLGLSGCRRNNGEKPNVVIVMTDDQGYGDLGAHGNPHLKTPTLDKLWKCSVRLTNFHTDPCCSPSRTSLLTGQYSARSGVWHTIGGRSLLAKDKLTMADIFQSSGYRTGIFGKWHLGENYPFRPQDRGFQETVVHGGGAVGANPDYWGNNYFDDTYIKNGEPKKFEGYCNTVWFNESLQFIRDSRERPFFCFLSTNLPHAPLIVEDRYIEPYKHLGSERLANYYGMLAKFDDDMARFLGEIRDLGLEEDTILIFLSDNGPCPWFGGIRIDDDGFAVEGYSAGMRGGKIWGYENAHRVPCFIRWPAGGIGGGKDIVRLTAHFDLLPTLMDACGLKAPDFIEFDGISLLDKLRDPDAKTTERTLFVHNQRVDFPVKYKDYQVLTERWRLIQPSRKGETIPELELYDIRNDPGQREDISSRHPEVVADLKRRYEMWWDDVSKDFNSYNNIIVGSHHENPAVLHAHDAHRKDGRQIWVIEAEHEGEYALKAFRWPEESGKTIKETKEGDAFSDIAECRLRIGNQELYRPVATEMRFAEFSVHLAAGQTCLESWFPDRASDTFWNAVAVSAQRIGPADPQKLREYRNSDPDRILKSSLPDNYQR